MVDSNQTKEAEGGKKDWADAVDDDEENDIAIGQASAQEEAKQGDSQATEVVAKKTYAPPV